MDSKRHVKQPKIVNNRKKIFKFIKKNMTDYDIMRTDFEDWIFEGDDEPNLEKLYKLNKKKLLKCSDSMIDYLLHTIKLIKKQYIHNMDKESMVVFPTSGFCWNARGKFVIFNER
jgi:hypothetical protein